jgi:uncharacterized protein (TIGR02145 family)
MSNLAYKEYISKLETLFNTAVKGSADGYYEGERNSAGNQHGFGTKYYSANDKNGMNIYVGEWNNGKRNGKGKLEWKNGASYDGEWKDGDRHGKGIYTNDDGLYYKGKWANDEEIGSSDWMYADYPIVKIGEQVWMQKNLDVETFRNGDVIPCSNSQEEWMQYAKNGKPAWCYYDNCESNKEYGKLYNWYAVSDPRCLAPSAWIVPNKNEWYKLVNYIGGLNVAGIKLRSKQGWDSWYERAENTDKINEYNNTKKEIEYLESRYKNLFESKNKLETETYNEVKKIRPSAVQEHYGTWPAEMSYELKKMQQELNGVSNNLRYWKTHLPTLELYYDKYHDGNGIDEVSFKALPGSFSNSNGEFTHGLGTCARWWTLTEDNTNEAWRIAVYNTMQSLDIETVSKSCGYSVRCLRE